MGECLKCGECCRWIAIVLPNLREKIWRDYYLKHGCKIKGKTLLIPSPCQHLTKDNLCAIYPNRPLFCKIWEGQKTSNKTDYFVPEGCGFK